MEKRSALFILLGSFLILLIGSGFTYPQISSGYMQPEDHYANISSIPSVDENDPEDEDICGLYEADCEDNSTINAKNVEIDLARAEKANVTVIFFWMQDCAHCTEVLNSLLPEMYLTFGEQVYFYPIELKDIEEIDVFYQMAERLGVPKNNIGVPLMIVGNQVLAGNQIDENLEKSIAELIPAPDFSFIAIPEFEERLPEFLRNKQMDINTDSKNQSDNNLPLRTTFPLAFVIGLPLLVIAGVFVVVIFKKSKQI
jgi:hypothetical protein